MALTKKQLGRLEELAEVNATRRNKLSRYLRHVGRIRTLERVLDPADGNARGVKGNEDSYRAEIERRKGEMADLEAWLKDVLDREEK